MKLRLVIFLLAVLGCHANKETSSLSSAIDSTRSTQTWNAVSFDHKISTNPIFARLDSLPESETFCEEKTRERKTSEVTFGMGGDSPGPYICSAYCCKTDGTMTVQIGFSSGFGGSGFSIGVKGEKFFVSPYKFSDMIIEGRKKPVYTVNSQRLALDKICYAIGDSLYGNISFDVTENDNEAITPLKAKGFFRAKVKPWPKTE